MKNNLEIPPEYMQWFCNTIRECSHGNVGLIIHIHDGQIDWVEKIHRITKKLDTCEENSKI